MRFPAILLAALLASMAGPGGALELPPALLERMRAADVVVLGEVHDNPAHHAVQAAAIRALAPKAVVWEMLTPETAAQINAAGPAEPDRVDRALALGEADWPGFGIYRPVLEAAADLPFLGALVPRSRSRAVPERGLAGAFGAEAARYGLTRPLPDAEQSAREAEQAEAHCNALPEEQLPMMVDIQRLRDAVLARAVVTALARHGPPVVVITGNGHARADRGMPAVLRRVRPGLKILALGQSEDGRIEGRFDAVLDAPAVDRSDPCAVFDRKG